MLLLILFSLLEDFMFMLITKLLPEPVHERGCY